MEASIIVSLLLPAEPYLLHQREAYVMGSLRLVRPGKEQISCGGSILVEDRIGFCANEATNTDMCRLSPFARESPEQNLLARSMSIVCGIVGVLR